MLQVGKFGVGFGFGFGHVEKFGVGFGFGHASPGSNRAITFGIVVRLICRLIGFERQICKIETPIARTFAGYSTLAKRDRFPSLIIIILVSWQQPVAIGFGAAVEKLSVAQVTDEPTSAKA